MLTALPASAATQEIRGRVVTGNVAVANADIGLLDQNGVEVASALTDDEGSFRLRAPRAGEYKLSVNRLGYAPWSSEPFALARRDAIEIEVQLGVDAIPLAPMRVVVPSASARSDFRSRAVDPARSGGQFIMREQIDRLAAVRASDLLRALTGVAIHPVMDPARAADDRNLVLLRDGGLNGCLASVYVDGISMQQSVDLTIDDYINPHSLEAIELYTSAATAPPGFPTRGGCGAILFWTRTHGHGEPVFSWKRLGVMLGAVGAMFVLAR